MKPSCLTEGRDKEKYSRAYDFKRRNIWENLQKQIYPFVRNDMMGGGGEGRREVRVMNLIND